MSNAATADIIAFTPRRPFPDIVEAEAARRIRQSGYHHWHMREQATGAPVPAPIRYLKMQIEFAARMLKTLDPLPQDFRSDGFWPS